MTESKATWLARFREHLARQGLRLTTQRRVIGEVFFDGGKHLSLEEIHELAREKKASIGYATVYRTMRLLVEGGLATENKFGESQTRYEPDLDGEHHDHLVCVVCGDIQEFEDDVIEARQAEVASSRGFTILTHRLEIYGRCSKPECQRAEASAPGYGGH